MRKSFERSFTSARQAPPKTEGLLASTLDSATSERVNVIQAVLLMVALLSPGLAAGESLDRETSTNRPSVVRIEKKDGGFSAAEK